VIGAPAPEEQSFRSKSNADYFTLQNNSHEIFLSMRDIRQQREMERRQMLREQEFAMFQHITSICKQLARS
jgi:hypothetical protein